MFDIEGFVSIRLTIEIKNEFFFIFENFFQKS